MAGSCASVRLPAFVVQENIMNKQEKNIMNKQEKNIVASWIGAVLILVIVWGALFYGLTWFINAALG